MQELVVTSELLNSNRWINFLKSTAIGLRITIILFIPGKENFRLDIPESCPSCNDRFSGLGLKALLPSPAVVKENPEGLNLTDGTIMYPLRDGLAMIVSECKCCTAGLWPLIERGRIAQKLITCFQVTLLDGIKNGQSAIELSAFRQVNQIIISLFYGESSAIERALELMLSALLIILNAQTSWLQYQDRERSHLFVKGDREKAELYLASKQEQPPCSDILTIPIDNQAIQGHIGVFIPEGHPRALPLLSLMAEQCLIVFKIDNLFRLVQAQTARILNVLDFAILMADVSGKIIYFNQVTKDLLGNNCLDWLESPENISAPWTKYLLEKAEKPVKRRKELFYYGEREYYIDWQLLPLKEDDQIAGWLVLVNDRTDYYQWQEIGHRAENFSTVASIIGPLAHELRNPLAASKGLLQLAHRRKEPEKTAGYIELVVQEIDRMSILVNEFLQLGRSVNTDFEPVNLCELIEKLGPLFEGEVLGRDVSIFKDLESVPLFMADSSQLTQVLLNLIRNAVEAIEHQGCITISTRRTEEWIILQVQDNGLGINTQVLKNLFQPFVTTKKKGTGLGLAMVKAIINNHQGKISAANLPEGGAVITIQFPMLLTDRCPLKKIDILIAIINEAIRYPTEQVFQASGFSMMVVEPIELDRGMVRKYKPGIIITDQCLSMEKRENIERLWPELYVFFIGEPSDFLPCARWKVIPTPLNYGEMVEEISTLLQVRRDY